MVHHAGSLPGARTCRYRDGGAPRNEELGIVRAPGSCCARVWITVSEARLLLTCGLPGAGKTTTARQLAADRSALRLTQDEWLIALGSSPWDAPVREKVDHELWRLAQDVLRLGLSVVLDFGLWARTERDEMRSAARDLGVGVELHYLDVPPDELWRRIQARNSEPPWNSYPIGRADFDEWLPHLPGSRCWRAGVVRSAARLKLNHG